MLNHQSNMILLLYHKFNLLSIIWYGDHSGGATPGLVSIPEVKSSSVLDCTVGAGLWELQDVAGLFIFILKCYLLILISKILFSLDI